MGDGKDATASVTNWALLAAPICTLLAANGVEVEASTVAALISVIVGFWGRWRAGGIKSAFGVAVPQPIKQEDRS